MNNKLAAEKDTEIANDEDIDFSFYDKMHLDKIQTHKISLPDLLNEFETFNDEGIKNLFLDTTGILDLHDRRSLWQIENPPVTNH